MGEHEFEEMLSTLMRRTDFSVGTERFREDLLARCLAVLNTADKEEIAYEIDDAELDLLAAAGDLFASPPSRQETSIPISGLASSTEVN